MSRQLDIMRIIARREALREESRARRRPGPLDETPKPITVAELIIAHHAGPLDWVVSLLWHMEDQRQVRLTGDKYSKPNTQRCGRRMQAVDPSHVTVEPGPMWAARLDYLERAAARAECVSGSDSSSPMGGHGLELKSIEGNISESAEVSHG